MRAARGRSGWWFGLDKNKVRCSLCFPLDTFCLDIDLVSACFVPSEANPSSAASLPLITMAAPPQDKTNSSSMTSVIGPSEGDMSIMKGIPMIAKALLALIVGVLIGGFVVTSLLEAEYQQIVTQLRSDHRISLSQLKNEYITCQSDLANEKKINDERLMGELDELAHSWEEDMSKLKAAAERNEQEYKQRVERHLKETNEAYVAANDGLEKASALLQSKQRELAQTNNRLEMSIRELENLEKARAVTERQLQAVRNELGEVGDELDRRDLERIECDENHRNLLQCQQSLEKAIGDSDNSSFEQDRVQSAQQLAIVSAQKDKLISEVEELREHEARLQEFVVDAKTVAGDYERDRDLWREKAEIIMQKIKDRSQKEVLSEYGEGPHRVELSLRFSTSPTFRTLLLELAPLDFVPHTIHTFLKMIDNQAFKDGTFVLARDHIIVGGPIDAHDPENNQRLEERMLRDGYFPNGALLFNEYNDAYPHTEYTIGFNAVGGPIFYINLLDNTDAHGSVDGEREGEPCFARVVGGFDVVQRIAEIPRLEDDSLESAVYIVGSRVLKA